MKRFYYLIVICISTLSCHGQNPNNDIICEIDSYIEMNKKFISSKGGDLILREKIESFTENKLPVILSKIENEICKDSNFSIEKGVLIDKFFEMILETQNSASEASIYTLISIYKCDSTSVIKEINKKNKLDFLDKILSEYGTRKEFTTGL